MREFQQVFWGVLIALLSVGIILGSMSVALIEGGMSAALESTPTSMVRLVTQPIPSILPPVSNAPSQTSAIMLITPQVVTSTPMVKVLSATPRCPQPRGWSVYLIQPGDTLESIAELFKTTAERLASENCLEVSSLFPGTELYVPNVYPTTAVVQCGPPANWVFYTVIPGDTLYHLSRLFRVTVAQLQFANCLGSSTLIRAGQRLYVPNVVKSTPRIIPTETQQPQPSDTATSVPSATFVFTSTPTQVSTATSTSTLVPTIKPSQTPTLPSTATDVPTVTSTSTDMPTVTSTPTDSSTVTPTQTSQPTFTNTTVPTTEVPTATSTPIPPTLTVTVTQGNH